MAHCVITIQRTQSNTSTASFTGTFEQCLESCKTHVNEELMWMIEGDFIRSVDIKWVPTKQTKENPNV